MASWNIHIQSGGLLQKFDAIEHLVSTYGLDIIALSECDYPADMPLPVMEGYDSYRSMEVPTRLIVYVKPHIVVNVYTYVSCQHLLLKPAKELMVFCILLILLMRILMIEFLCRINNVG